MIHPLKYYSITELEDLAKEGFFPIKERLTILKLIDQGILKAINISSIKKPLYKIKGEDLLAFLDSRGTYHLSKVDGKHYSSKKYSLWPKKPKNSETANKKGGSSEGSVNSSK